MQWENANAFLRAFLLQPARQNNQSDNFKIFSSFESSIKAFDNIFGNVFSIMNIMLLKFLIVLHSNPMFAKWMEILVAKWTELALYR